MEPQLQRAARGVFATWGYAAAISSRVGTMVNHFWRVSVLLAAAWGASPAKADFAVCNQTFDMVNVAIGKSEGDVFVTDGWWTIGPNQCANVLTETLSVRYVYVFAQDVFGNVILSGATRMCVAPDRFTIRGDSDCIRRGFIEAPFHEVDTLRSERWTLFLTEPPA